MEQQTKPESSSSQNQTQACCTSLPEISPNMLGEETEVLSALANTTRYGAIRLLAGADGEVCACNLAPPLDVSQSAVSHALTRLYKAGLVERRKQGRWRYYRTTPLAERLIEVFDAQQTGDK
jgi:ArsR family transcriptional regulator